MSENTDSNIRRTREGFYSVRIRAGRHPRTGKGQQVRVTIVTRDPKVFERRLARLRELSAALIPGGLTAEAAVAIRKAAAQPTDDLFDLMCETALVLAPKVPHAKPHQWNTVRKLGEAWTSGALHARFPDHVKSKRTSDRDKGRLEYLYELIVDTESKRKLGDMPLALLTFEHANAAMVQLPDDCKRPAARRQYAQLIARVMKLAVFPAACIAASPLPPGFLPHVPEGDILFQHLYPDEDLRLMRCGCAFSTDTAMVDYGERGLFGLSNREGGRLGEFLRGLKWVGIDPKRGTITLPGGVHRKGGKPSKWQAEPGSIEALEPLRALGLEGPFYHLPDDGKWAERLQARMRAAGLDREALYYSNVDEGVRRMRGHDTRATYLTLGIASGLSETHLMARTGHTTSKMVHRYDHAAEALAASDSGCRLMPLDFALGLYTVLRYAKPGPRRSGWMTLDPTSAEADALERLALPGGSGMRLLGAGDDGPSGGALDGELVDDDQDAGAPLAGAHGDATAADGPVQSPKEGAAGLALAAPEGLLAAARAETGEVEAQDWGEPRRDGAPLLEQAREGDSGVEVFSVHGSMRGAAERHDEGLGRVTGGRLTISGVGGGETRSVTSWVFHGVGAEACGKNGSRFDAVAPAGVEPARPLGRGILNAPNALLQRQDDAPEPQRHRLSLRNPVAECDGKLHRVSPRPPEVRPEMSPSTHADSGSTALASSAGAAPAGTPPETSDPVLAALLAAAHAALEREDDETLDAIVAVIRQHRAGLAGAREGAPEGAEAGATPGARRGGA